MRVGIVGAGFAGLAAAIEAQRAGHEVAVFEASDGPGGRVRTDVVDGYRLDRGFQILLTAYPQCQELMDYERLDLRSFSPGALVRIDGGMHRLGDPLREPTQLFTTVTAPVGSLSDKLRILAYRLNVTRRSVDDVWDGVGTTAIHRLRSIGFSDTMIERFLRPLFTGITLDADLKGSSQVIDFVFKMLSAGDAAVPAHGMGELSRHLESKLLDGTIRFRAPVAEVTPTSIAVEGGTAETFDRVVVAVDASEAARLVGTPDPGWSSVTTVWFAADESPVDEPVLVLNGEGTGPINSLAPMSRVSDAYAPPGRSVFAVSAPSLDDDLPAAFRRQLTAWFGPVVETWDEVRVDRIERAQPVQLPGFEAKASVEVEGIYVAGDHRRDASLNGALESGRAALRAAVAG